MAIEFLALENEHPFLRVASQVARGNSVEQLVKEWGELKGLMDGYFEMIKSALSMCLTKEQSHGE